MNENKPHELYIVRSFVWKITPTLSGLGAETVIT